MNFALRNRLIKPAIITAGVIAAGLLLFGGLLAAQRMGWIGSRADAGDEDQTYMCPMHPDQRKQGPGRCPICGMPLEPISSSGMDLIDPVARRLGGIKTAKATVRQVYQTIETIGSIAYDESQLATIPAYIDGRIERVFADYTGVEVAAGDHLAVLYSPGLYAAQVEYLQARDALKELDPGILPAVRQAQERLVSGTRQKLIEYGMSDEQVRLLDDLDNPRWRTSNSAAFGPLALGGLLAGGRAQSRLTLYSPISGTVIEKMAHVGKYVKAGDPIYRVADLRLVWLMLELFPEDAARIRFGQQVEATVYSQRKDKFLGRVAFIDREVNPKTRTVGVRVELKNPAGKLRPNDYASAVIRVPLGEKGVVFDKDLAGKWISPMHPQIIRGQPGSCPICGMDLVPSSRYGYSDTPVPQPKVLTVPRNAVLTAGSDSAVYVEGDPGRFELRPVRLDRFVRADAASGAIDLAVILEGLEPDEIVATDGNFLIDSQMQLAGKPSLIDVKKVKDRPRMKKEPLTIPSGNIHRLAGGSGRQLEKLFDAYFAMQRVYADDKNVTEAQVEQLQAAARSLLLDEALAKDTRTRIERLATDSAHLHHMDLEKSRAQFRVVSQNVILLAARHRGADSSSPFIHFHCPMVPGGGGDWLQPGGTLANPYFGSQMLRCGKLVHELPAQGTGPILPEQK